MPIPNLRRGSVECAVIEGGTFYRVLGVGGSENKAIVALVFEIVSLIAHPGKLIDGVEK